MARRRSNPIRNAPWGAAAVLLTAVVAGLVILTVGTVLALVEGHHGQTPYDGLTLAYSWACCGGPLLITVWLLIVRIRQRRRAWHALQMARRMEEAARHARLAGYAERNLG